jgi:hypothetical protein
MPEPFRPDDELVSAVLDGEATPDERARVAADPVLAARLAEFTVVAEAVGAPVETPAEAARDAAVAAALAERRRPDPVVVPLRPRRSNGSFLAIAAAVMGALLLAGLLAGRLDSGGDDQLAGGGDSADTAESAGDGGEESGGTAAAEDATSAPETGDTATDAFSPATVELGEVSDEAALREALVASGALAGVGTSPTTTSTVPQPTTPSDLDTVRGESIECQVRLEEADPALDGLLVEGTAVYAGTPAVVYVFATVDGETRVVVVTEAGCETLVSFPF